MKTDVEVSATVTGTSSRPRHATSLQTELPGRDTTDVLIRRYLRDNESMLVFVATLAAASSGLAMLMLDFLNRRAVEGLFGQHRAALAEGALLLGAVLTVRVTSAYVVSGFASRLVAELRRHLCERFLAIDLEKLMHRKHAINGALIEDIDRVATLLQVAPQFVNNALLVQ